MPALGAILVAFAAIAYGPYLGLPFVGDDYGFLDRTMGARFGDLWSFRNTDFGWYRPLSRELHFWLLGHVLRLEERGFRVVAIALWVVALLLYARVVLAVTGSRAATTVAVLGVAGLALWGAPLVWISGSQDLWMLVFSLLALACFIEGRTGRAAAALALALLSKETALVMPALFLAHATLVSRDDARRAWRRVAPSLAVALVWLVVHPVLLERAARAWDRPTGEAEESSPLGAVLRSVLANFNLDVVPRPETPTPGGIALIVAASAMLAAGAWLLSRSAMRDGQPSPGGHRRVVRFGLVWAAVGWSPVLLPTVGWQAYYGGLGALGVWLVAGVALSRHSRAATGVVLMLALAGGLRSATPSWEWGSAWYQRRAGSLLGAIRTELKRQHPTLAPHSRVYFGRIPNNVGLIAGDRSAVRVWYRDATLSAAFYTWYRPRRDADPPGRDYFFRFDSVRVLVEVRTGPEDVARAIADNPEWANDHERLAMLFVRAADYASAAAEFEKLSSLPERGNDAILAAVCLELAGDARRSDSLYQAAAARLRVPLPTVAAAASRLRASVPLASADP